MRVVVEWLGVGGGRPAPGLKTGGCLTRIRMLGWVARPAQQRASWLVRTVGVRRRALCSTPRLSLAEDVGAREDSGQVVQASWSPGSQRCGALGVKCGMMSLFDGYGVRRTVTVMLLDDLQVTQVKCPPHDEVTALQVGLGVKRAHRVSKSVRNHFQQQGLAVKQKVAQFTVTPDALMPVGTPITARHFVPGQFVDVQVRVHRCWRVKL